MPSQHDKAMRFRALHETPGIFVIPNVWDGGSASVMAGLGFEALATTSSGFAGTLGRLDGATTRDEPGTILKISAMRWRAFWIAMVPAAM